MMNPQGMMQFISALNTFKTNHPKFAGFIELVIKGGLPEGTVIEISVTRPGENAITANMMVQQSDIELMQTLKNMKS